MELLYAFVKARIGNRIVWNENGGKFVGEITEVEKTDGDLLLITINSPDLSGNDPYNGAGGLPPKTISVSTLINEETVDNDGNIRLVPTDSIYTYMRIRPYRHGLKPLKDDLPWLS